MQEIWKDVEGFEGLYQVSNLGNVKSLERSVRNHKSGATRTIKEHILMAGRDKDGYLQVNLCKSGRMRAGKIHRLVAKAFIPNPENKPQVNHKDGNKNNNVVNNLEWNTKSENLIHSLYVLENTHGKKSKRIVCVETNEVFPSISEAARKTGAKQPHISQCLKGKRHQSGGYHWRELNEREP